MSSSYNFLLLDNIMFLNAIASLALTPGCRVLFNLFVDNALRSFPSGFSDVSYFYLCLLAKKEHSVCSVAVVFVVFMQHEVHGTFIVRWAINA